MVKHKILMRQYSCTIFSIYKAQCYKILPQYQGESVVVERHQTFWNVARGIFSFLLSDEALELMQNLRCLKKVLVVVVVTVVGLKLMISHADT